MYGNISDPGMEIILPGCDGTSALARGATLAARWLHEPQTISNQPGGLGFPHRAGVMNPGDHPVWSPGCRSCRCMEGFLIRRWHLILPGMCWLCTNTSQLAIGWWGWGFHAVWGDLDPGELRFRPQFVGAVLVWKDL